MTDNFNTSKMPRAVGADVGTMFFQVAENDNAGQTNVKTIRNCFVELAKTDGINEMLRTEKFQWIEDERNVYVIGEDAIRFARMLPGKVDLRRPLQDGVLNAGEEMKMQVLNELIRSSIGKAEDKRSVACTCVSSPPVDGSPNNTFHERRLKGMFENQGWNCQIIEKGLAVVLAERPTMVEADGTEVPFTGIGLSFGAGRVNCVLAYKGVTAVGMSASRSGDWIDREVAAQLAQPVAKITAFKESAACDLGKIGRAIKSGEEVDDIPFGVYSYTEAMMRYVFEMFAMKFNSVKSDFERPLDIVVAGGTSTPGGFVQMLEDVVRPLDMPFKIKEVRHSKDPRNAVCKGLLARAIITMKQAAKKESLSADDILRG